MEKFLPKLKKSRLFEGLGEFEILTALKCLNANLRAFSKNSIIMTDGSVAEFVGILLLGEVETQKTDFDGNASMVAKLYPTDLIAASACYSSKRHMPVDIISISYCEILCLDIKRLITPCRNACGFHSRIIENMLGIIADRNIQLTDKIEILSKRTIKEKVLTYLHAHSKKAKGRTFSIPLTRRQMADYLSVNRSALSRELCRLQAEGLLEFDKNRFKLTKL